MTLQELLKKHELNDEERNIFQEYIKNCFDNAKEIEESDTTFLNVWEKILEYSKVFGVDRAINDKVCAKRPVEFSSSDTLKLEIYDSLAGKIPIIYVSDSSDFENLVTNIAYKGIRPDNISSTGASFIYGKTTRFIILSAKPYSNVPAAELGLSDEHSWEEKSLILRRGHECTHYFTKQTYGISNNILHDEIMADFIGMYEAFGFYKAEWFLRFMGVITGSGDRLIVYTKELPKRVRLAVSELAEISAHNLEEWSHTQKFKEMSSVDRVKYMCSLGLEGMLNIS